MERRKPWGYARILTEDELMQIEKRQAEVGILNRSSYLRKMALNGICIHLNSEDLQKASSLLWRTSNNMNQHAKKAITIYLMHWSSGEM